MRVPLEIALALAALSISQVQSGMKSESAIDRVTSAIVALGGLMMAIAGRLPPAPGQRGLSGFVVAGAVVIGIGIGVRVIASAGSLIRQLAASGRRTRV